jgi:hypothetical protein
VRKNFDAVGEQTYTLSSDLDIGLVRRDSQSSSELAEANVFPMRKILFN